MTDPKTITTEDEKVPVCQRCGKFGIYPLSGICDECEIEEITEVLNENTDDESRTSNDGSNAREASSLVRNMD